MSRLDNLSYIINYLKSKDDKLSNLQLPDTLKERQQMMRALLNIREPRPVSEDFLEAQDAELLQQKKDKGIVDVAIDNRLDEYNLSVWHGDITRLKVDAIVNAANSQML